VIRSPLAAVLVLSGTLSAQEPLKPVVSTPSSSFVVQEASVSGIHTALATGMIDCAELTKAYLRRIEAYDDQGPKLNAILTVNPRA
ncbi:uncharacterized protein METZ01_LOCUS239198, partial [marine metagenome]